MQTLPHGTTRCCALWTASRVALFGCTSGVADEGRVAWEGQAKPFRLPAVFGWPGTLGNCSYGNPGSWKSYRSGNGRGPASWGCPRDSLWIGSPQAGHRGPRRRGTNLKICPSRVGRMGYGPHEWQMWRFTPRWPPALWPSPPALSRSHAGLASRTSFRGRGGSHAAKPLTPNRSPRCPARWLSPGPSPPPGGEKVADRPDEGGQPGFLTPLSNPDQPPTRTRFFRPPPGPLPQSPGCSSPDVVSRERGHTRAAGPRARRRSDSPTPARGVGSGGLRPRKERGESGEERF
jgi:hypothetical protein